MPSWHTRYQRARSGRELRVADYRMPIWEFTLTYSILRDMWDIRGVSPPPTFTPGAIGPQYAPGAGPIGDGAGFNELRTLMGFYLQQQGSGIPFLYRDPTDNSVNQLMATGDGVTSEFQLFRNMGIGLLKYLDAGNGFFESVTAIDASSVVITLNGSPVTGYALDDDTGLLTFPSPPGSGVLISASFNFYFRVRFSDDTNTFENFMWQLWELKQIKFQSVINLPPLPSCVA